MDRDSAVIISNHQSLVDYIVINYLARYSTVDPVLQSSSIENDEPSACAVNFFTWFRLWKLPSIRMLFNVAKCDENWELDPSLSTNMFQKVMKSKKSEWIVLFPEVNVFSEEDAELQDIQAQKFFLPRLQYVLYPRFSSFYNVISTLHNKKNFKFTKLYDISLKYCILDPANKDPKHCQKLEKDQGTHLQPQNHLSLLEAFASKKKWRILVNVRSKQLIRIPTKRKNLEKWLEKCWVRKDKTIEQFDEVGVLFEEQS